jgi:hypothetical protein
MYNLEIPTYNTLSLAIIVFIISSLHQEGYVTLA